MRTIIAGGREFKDATLMEFELAELPWRITTVVSGAARGADQLGEEWARNNDIDVSLWPANWDTHGKGAGFIRNQEMADYADALVAFWDGKSKGTKDMIERAINNGLYVKVVKYE